jgi:hypothetical protein
MSDHHQSTGRPPGPPPTAKQQAYLRRLALARGISFTPPRTVAEASRLIDELKRRRPDPAGDRARELKAVRADLQTGRGDAARVRGHETTGYGSTATWNARER